jgi:CRP-like cAMP-binding protein
VVDVRISTSELDLFKGFSPAEAEALQELFEWCELPVGTVLFEQGEIALNVYLVVKGEVMVRYKPEDGPALIVSRLHSQGVVGWSAVIGSPTYTSSAECGSDCVVLRVCSDDLRAFVEQHPAAGARLLDRLGTMIAERMRNTHEHVMALLEQGLRVQSPR